MPAIWWTHGTFIQGFELEKQECFSLCSEKANQYVEDYECVDDTTVYDSLNRQCSWYRDHAEVCGYFDTVGEQCEEYGEGQCSGDFSSKEACCAC